MRDAARRDRYRSGVAPTSIDTAATDRELEIQLQTELALARAERDAARVRASARRRARIRFALIALVLLGIGVLFAYLSYEAMREAFGASLAP